MGFFISGHPLDRYTDEINMLHYTTHNTDSIQELQDGDYVCIAGVTAAYREKVLKSGDGKKMAFATFEDCYGQIPVMCPAKSYNDCADYLKSDEVCIIGGRIKMDIIPSEDPEAEPQKTVEIILDTCKPITQKRTDVLGFILFNIDEKTSVNKLNQFEQLLKNNPGNCRAFLRINYENNSNVLIPLEKYNINATDTLLSSTYDLFGKNAIVMKPRTDYAPTQFQKSKNYSKYHRKD